MGGFEEPFREGRKQAKAWEAQEEKEKEQKRQRQEWPIGDSDNDTTTSIPLPQHLIHNNTIIQKWHNQPLWRQPPNLHHTPHVIT
jgi:hypothetical protein